MAEPRLVLSSQELLQKYEFEKGKFDALNRRKENLYDLLMETNTGIEALKELQKGKNQDILVPLGSGVYVSAKITSEKVKSSQAGGLVLNKSPKNVLDDLEKRKTDLEKHISKIDEDQLELTKEIATLENLIQQVAAHKEKEMTEKNK